jgi:hypothetical protein
VAVFSNADQPRATALRRLPDCGFVPAPIGIEPKIAGQRATVAALRAAVLRVVIAFLPQPSDFDLAKCWERRAEGLPIAGPHRLCTLATDNLARQLQQFDKLLVGFEAVTSMIRPDQALCGSRVSDVGDAGKPGSRVSDVGDAGKPIFHETGHFTLHRSLVVGRRLRLGETAYRVAP